MKILWLINVPLPEASFLMNEEPSKFGGWLHEVSRVLSLKDGIDLSIAFPHKKITKYKKIDGKNIVYYPFNYKVSSKISLRSTSDVFLNILTDSNPDIVHIHGTEFAHSHLMSIACDLRKTKYVTSIQGLVSEIAKHMSADLPNSVIYGMTLRNFINLDSIYLMSKSFKKRGYNELKLLKKSANVIGRTTWDKALTRQINSSIRYFHCNESLRGEFYKHKWDYDKCEKHSMFLSQGQYSIKGLHYVLEALPLIIEKFPDIKLYIAGKDITKLKSIKDRLFITYYGKYIRKLIKKYRLGKHVVFTGPLSEKKMCERYLKSNIFICPSSIENSPNSLGEAMLLGVPSIASYVGGVPDMLVDKEEGFLYQHNVPYMLAYYVSRIFNNKELALKLSEKAKEHALRTHDRNENSKILIEIYNDILEKKAE